MAGTSRPISGFHMMHPLMIKYSAAHKSVKPKILQRSKIAVPHRNANAQCSETA
jgi:hypothetical protein